MWAAQNFLAKGDNSKWRKVELLFMCMRHLPTMNNNCIKLFWNPSMHNKDMGQTRFFDKGRRLKNQESQGYSSCTWHTFWLWATTLWSYFKIHLWLNKIGTGQEKDMGRTQFFWQREITQKRRKVELLFMCMTHLLTKNNNCMKLFWNPSMHNKDMGRTRFFDKGR